MVLKCSGTSLQMRIYRLARLRLQVLLLLILHREVDRARKQASKIAFFSLEGQCHNLLGERFELFVLEGPSSRMRNACNAICQVVQKTATARSLTRGI